MEEEMQFIVDTAKENMEQALKHLDKEMLNIRAGKANPIMLSGVKVDYYGTPTPLSQVANVNSPDGRTLTVQPWEKAMLSEIEKSRFQNIDRRVEVCHFRPRNVGVVLNEK